MTSTFDATVEELGMDTSSATGCSRGGKGEARHEGTAAPARTAGAVAMGVVSEACCIEIGATGAAGLNLKSVDATCAGASGVNVFVAFWYPWLSVGCVSILISCGAPLALKEATAVASAAGVSAACTSSWGIPLALKVAAAVASAPGENILLSEGAPLALREAAAVASAAAAPARAIAASVDCA